MTLKGTVITGAVVVVVGGLLMFRLYGMPTMPMATVSPKPSASTTVTKRLTPRPSASVTVSMSPSVSPTVTPTATVTVTPTASAVPTPSVTGQVNYLVSIHNFMFDPSPLTVAQGSLITFRNNDQVSQSVTSLNNMFDSKTLAPGSQWVLDTTRLAPGTYEYRSTPHPSVRGTILVQ